MKNILFLHSSSELYGSDRSLLNIIKGLNKEKYKINVILPCEGELVKEIKKVNNVEVTIKNIAVLRRKNLSIKGLIKYFIDFIKSYIFLKKFIKTNKIDLVYTNTSVIFIGGIVAKHLHIKSIWHIREIITNKYENKIISYIINKYSDLIIANSTNTLNSLNIDKSKGRVIYNSIIPSKNIKNIKHNNFIVGMAGRINRWKGQKLFVDALEIIVKKDTEIVFEIAGEVYKGEEHIKDDLIQYIKEKNLQERITLLGQIENMEDFYNHLDIFVLPSIKPEPFGLVILEAMQYGVPVVATNHGGPTEIIKNGDNGILFEHNKPNELSDAILKIKNDKQFKEKLSKNGQKRFNEFSLQNMIKELEKNIDKLIN